MCCCLTQLGQRTWKSLTFGLIGGPRLCFFFFSNGVCSGDLEHMEETGI